MGLFILAKNIKLLFLALFLIGLISVFVYRFRQVEKTKSIPFSPQQSSFALEPPADALKGKILFAKGKVEKEPRGKDDFEEVGVEEEILQGEKLATGDESQATVEFSDFARIDLGPDTEIEFINLIPSSFLINQTAGLVNYRVLQDSEPVSVRSLHALLTFNSGESEVTVREEEVIIKILSDQAKLALVDLENETHVWQLEEGQRALINVAERRVEIE